MSQIKQSNNISTVTRILLFLMVFVSPLLVLQLLNKELFLWMQILFIIFMFIRYKKMNVIKSPLVLMLFLEPFIAGIFAISSSMPDVYKKTAINLAIMAIPLYFTICCISKLIDKGTCAIEIIIKAIKNVIIIEMIWIFIQLIMYRVLGVDINKVIFVDTLHMVKNASFIRSWVWYPSGLSWHSAVLAPLFVMGILFFDSTVVRMLILLVSFLCGNSTTLLGVAFCLILLFLKTIYTRKIEISKKQFTTFIFFIFILCIALMTTDIGYKLSQVLAKLWIRLFGAEKDASTAAHLGYYSDYITILKNSSISQVLFGYGTGCSGYTITLLYGRYADGGTWAIESDYINILVSRGIIGFISYYWFLLYVMIKGIRIDNRYGIFILTLLFQGFGYNVQFDYLLLIEAVMYISIIKHINFFNVVDKMNRRQFKKRGKYAQNFNNCSDV